MDLTVGKSLTSVAASALNVKKAPNVTAAANELVLETTKHIPVAGPIILAMITGKGTNVNPLGESLTNPSFPTEFNLTDFYNWAGKMGFRYEHRNNSVEFKDSEGHVVRRIISQKKDNSKVHIDRIWIYENGQEVKKFLKKANEPVKYYYDKTPEGIYSVAELSSNGQWYDLKGRIMQFNPITNTPQEGYVKPSSSLGESLTKPAFPEDFDIQIFEKWAKSLGLPAPVLADGVATFYDWNDKIVRQIKELKIKPGKVQEDCIPIYDKETGNKIGELIKWYISPYPIYHYGRAEDGTLKKTAQLGEDGLWHTFGRDRDDVIHDIPTIELPQLG